MKTLCCAIALALACVASGQKIAVSWGTELETETNVYSFLAEKNGWFFTLTGHKDEMFIERYSCSTLTQDFSKQLVLPKVDEKEQTLEAIHFVKDRFMLFTSLFETGQGRLAVYAYTMDMNGKLCHYRQDIAFFPAASRAEAGELGFYLSDDSTRVLVSHTARPEKGKILRVTLKLIDENMQTVTAAKEEFAASEEDESYSISNYSVNNAGEIFFLETMSAPASRKGPAKQRTVIVMFGADGKRGRDFPIGLEGKRIDQLLFSFDVAQNLVVSGFYEEKSAKGVFSYSGLSGTFFLTIDRNTGKEKSRAFREISNDILESFFTTKELEKRPLLPNNFIPRRITRKNDGGMVSVYEQYTSSQNGGTETTFYGDLLVTNVNADGSIRWIKLVPKRQVSVQRKAESGTVGGSSAALRGGFMFDRKNNETLYYSYMLGIKDEKIILVFNDDPLNEKIPTAHESETLQKITGAVPMMVTLSEYGEISKESIFESADFDIVLRPMISYQSSCTRLLLCGSKGRADKFGVMNIQ